MGHDEDRVEAQFVLAITRVARKPVLGCIYDAIGLRVPDRGLGFVEGGAALHLDKGEARAAGGDDVDLAERRSMAPCEDPVTFGDEECGGEAFTRQASREPRKAVAAAGR